MRAAVDSRGKAAIDFRAAKGEAFEASELKKVGGYSAEMDAQGDVLKVDGDDGRTPAGNAGEGAGIRASSPAHQHLWIG
ncbi:hypothetical protein IEQ34_010732 [Dendrobium chrysotoxum]|uniref:Uncharacterized protein n=1 Tax=Dendrobium chrysotoxum TaxID=161865 RepID=A0AAV7GX90_DENCH|nr:hypothetical protein IEQ34_010732 [Dendrobium chrysotoxum]